MKEQLEASPSQISCPLRAVVIAWHWYKTRFVCHWKVVEDSDINVIYIRPIYSWFFPEKPKIHTEEKKASSINGASDLDDCMKKKTNRSICITLNKAWFQMD